MTHPFNEDHPDFTGFAQHFIEDEGIIPMTQVILPVPALYSILLEEQRGLRWHFYATIMSMVAVLAFIAAPFFAGNMSGWVALILATLQGGIFSMLYVSLMPRRARYLYFIKPAIEAIRKGPTRD